MKTFFLESTCACVLGPWPWPRAFLFLASRVSVLGLEPCVLDSTSANYSRLGYCLMVIGLASKHNFPLNMAELTASITGNKCNSQQSDAVQLD